MYSDVDWEMLNLESSSYEDELTIAVHVGI